MTQIGTARDHLDPGLGGNRRQPAQGRAVTLVLRVAGAFADIEALDEQRLTDIGGIVGTIKLTVAHQHMEPVDAARQKSGGAARGVGRCAATAAAAFDCRRRGRHPSPIGPPAMRGPQTLDQERARITVDPHPGFAMQRRQWKTCREKRVGAELVARSQRVGRRARR